jgi:hypothetical protein
MKTLRVIYLCCGLACAGWYGLSEAAARESKSAAYERIDPSVRLSTGSSGGSGSHFWYSGSNGGK